MKILLLAGEASGDLYGAAIARALRRRVPGVELRAMGGRHLSEAGVELVVDSTTLSVVGLTEVLARLPSLLRARWALRRLITSWHPDVIVPIDYPDFNIRICRWARERGIDVAWFVSPQVWAWRSGRIAVLGRAITRMLVILPFEVEAYRSRGVRAEHVGHPLLDLRTGWPSPAEARARLGIPPDAQIVALLPGSRRSEVKRTWPVLREAAVLLSGRSQPPSFLVPLAPGTSPESLERIASSRSLPLRFIADAPTALAACDAAAVASGTATLEAALTGCPFVTGYRVSAITAFLGRFLLNRDFLRRGLLSLPNLVLGDEVVPELYQGRFHPAEVAGQVSRLLDDGAARERMRTRLSELPGLLGGPGTFDRVATAVIDIVARPPCRRTGRAGPGIGPWPS